MESHYVQWKYPLEIVIFPKTFSEKNRRKNCQELCMESTHYGVTLGHLDSSQLQLLLDEALASRPGATPLVVSVSLLLNLAICS